jgi:hypothetical protein
LFAEVGNSDITTPFPSTSAALVSRCWTFWVACCFLCRRMNRKRKRKMVKAARTAAMDMPALAPEERPFEPVEFEFPGEVPVGPGILDDDFEVLGVCDWAKDVVVERAR